MRIRHVLKPEAATTLAEVVMATAILGIMAAGIIGVFNYGFLSLRLVRENQRATQIMLEKVETIRLYNWDQVNSNGFIPTTFTDTYNPQGPTNAQGVVYHGTVTITNLPGDAVSYGTNMRELIVTLQWSTDGDIDHNRTLATCIAKDGIQNYVY